MSSPIPKKDWALPNAEPNPEIELPDLLSDKTYDYSGFSCEK